MEIENGDIIGSDRIGSQGNDSGSASGSGSDGSDGRFSGSGGNVDRSGGNVDRSDGSGSDGSGSGSDGNFGSSTNSSDERTSDANERHADGNEKPNVSRSDRERRRKPVRLGSFGSRDTRSADGSDGSGGSEFGGSSGVDSEPVFRLGSKPKGRPRTKVSAESTGNFKVSETKELVSVFLNSIFEIPAITLAQDFWRLSKDENKMLTDALVQWLESLPKSQSSKIAQFINEHLPLLNLAMIAFFILADRVKASIAIYQVSKGGKAFEAQVKETVKQQAEAPISTPLDNMFQFH